MAKQLNSAHEDTEFGVKRTQLCTNYGNVTFATPNSFRQLRRRRRLRRHSTFTD